ncbi:hypothetical protein KI440_03450 [Candidatus Saccharibacteria bacterium TM7i]|nr:hypothetical protein KI440_03450 [Candidatus Saccharibacteria bacterium TM7i]
MFQLDDKFLQDIGLADLPDEQKKPFLQHIYEQLEYQVGMRLSEGMSDEQLEEFEGIIDRKPEVVNAWLQAKVPQLEADPLFAKMQESTGLVADNFDLKAEYAATKWLEVNRPDYRNVVAQTLEALKQEVISNRDAILGTPPAA